MRRPGFTLIEIAMVLTLLLALAALSFPALRSLSDRVMLDEAVERVRAELLMARADAQREGTPIRVWAERNAEGGWRVSARRLSLSEAVTSESATMDAGGLIGSDLLGAETAERDPGGAASAMAASGASGAGPSPVARTLATLPRGIRLSEPGVVDADQLLWDPEFPLEAAGGEIEGDLLLAGSPDLGSDEPSRMIALGVYLPDGSVLDTIEFDVVGSSGGAEQRVRVRVSQWTGRAEIVEIPKPGFPGEAMDPGQEGAGGEGMDPRQPPRTGVGRDQGGSRSSTAPSGLPSEPPGGADGAGGAMR